MNFREERIDERDFDEKCQVQWENFLLQSKEFIMSRLFFSHTVVVLHNTVKN